MLFLFHMEEAKFVSCIRHTHKVSGGSFDENQMTMHMSGDDAVFSYASSGRLVAPCATSDSVTIAMPDP